MEYTSEVLEQTDKRYLWHPFTQQQDWEAEPQIIIERAEGSYVIDSEGKRYLDGVSSLWVNVHGHQRQEINQAIKDQLERVAHTTFLGLTHPSAIELARRLSEIAPGKLRRVFYFGHGGCCNRDSSKNGISILATMRPCQTQQDKIFLTAQCLSWRHGGCDECRRYQSISASLSPTPVHDPTSSVCILLPLPSTYLISSMSYRLS